jgi:hypothetical protein
MRYINVKIDLPYLAGFIASLLVAFGLAQGTVQKYVHFAGELNELATFITILTLALVFAIGAFKIEKDGK